MWISAPLTYAASSDAGSTAGAALDDARRAVRPVGGRAHVEHEGLGVGECVGNGLGSGFVEIGHDHERAFR
jgi:hypothetical protein